MSKVVEERSAGPLTPELVERTKISGVMGASRNLADSFNSLAIAEEPIGAESPAKSPRSSECTPTDTDGSDQSSSELDLGKLSTWEQSQKDLREPILQNNDERFCLLPVK